MTPKEIPTEEEGTRVPRAHEAAASQPGKARSPWPAVGRYLQGVVGGHGPGPLHGWGGGAVQQLQRILHYGKGGKEKSPG